MAMRRPLDETERSYRGALTLAETLEMRPLQARCRLGLGKLFRRTGRLDEARAELSTAIAMLREMGMASGSRRRWRNWHTDASGSADARRAAEDDAQGTAR